MTQIKIDVKTDDFQRTMKEISVKAFPDAMADALNQTADAITKQQIKNVKRNFTVRTPYTMRSMESARARPYKALNKASGRDIQKMFSRVGTTSRYLWKQEEGGAFGSESGGPVPIATKAARTGKSPKKSIRRSFRLRSGRLKEGVFSGIKKSFIGRVMVNGKRKLGLYLRSGSHSLTMLRNLDSNQIRIRPTGFHDKAVKKYGTGQFIAAKFKKAAEKYIRRAVK